MTDCWLAEVLDWMTLDWLRGCDCGTSWRMDTGTGRTEDAIPVPGGGRFWLFAVLLLELPFDCECVDVANATTDVTDDDEILVTTDRCWSWDACCCCCCCVCWWSIDEEIVLAGKATTAVAPVFLSGDIVLVGSDESNLSHSQLHTTLHTTQLTTTHRDTGRERHTLTDIHTNKPTWVWIMYLYYDLCRWAVPFSSNCMWRGRGKKENCFTLLTLRLVSPWVVQQFPSISGI